jgi:hypothetical protein
LYRFHDGTVDGGGLLPSSLTWYFVFEAQFTHFNPCGPLPSYTRALCYRSPFYWRASNGRIPQGGEDCFVVGV